MEFNITIKSDAIIVAIITTSLVLVRQETATYERKDTLKNILYELRQYYKSNFRLDDVKIYLPNLPPIPVRDYVKLHGNSWA